MNEDIPLSELAPRLARAMLPHVPFDGWSPAARAAAARDTGIDPDIAAMALPDIEAMLSAWTQDVDARMADGATQIKAEVRHVGMELFDQDLTGNIDLVEISGSHTGPDLTGGCVHEDGGSIAEIEPGREDGPWPNAAAHWR